MKKQIRPLIFLIIVFIFVLLTGLCSCSIYTYQPISNSIYDKWEAERYANIVEAGRRAEIRIAEQKRNSNGKYNIADTLPQINASSSINIRIIK